MVTRLAALAGSIPVIVEETFHQVHFSVAPTNMAAHENAGELGFFGSIEQELIAELESFIADKIPTSSAPVGTLAKAEPTALNPDGGHFTDGDGTIFFTVELFLTVIDFFIVEDFLVVTAFFVATAFLVATTFLGVMPFLLEVTFGEGLAEAAKAGVTAMH